MRTAATETLLVSLEPSGVSWKSISYGEILIVVCDGWRVRLPRRGELEDDVRSLELPRRSARHVVEGHVVQFDPQAPHLKAFLMNYWSIYRWSTYEYW